MTVGLLIITHDRIGATLEETARNILGVCPLATEVLAAPLDCDPSAVLERARRAIDRLDTGAGVLVLTDLYGGTPANIASRLQSTEDRIRVVVGVNLPMLVRILNYANLSLDELTEKALSGGRDGVFLCAPCA